MAVAGFGRVDARLSRCRGARSSSPGSTENTGPHRCQRVRPVRGASSRSDPA